MKVRATSRLTFHAFGGQQDDRNARLDRDANRIAKNQNYGANLMYRWGASVVTGIEASRVRTSYLGGAVRNNPHYDIAIGYLF